MEFLIELLFDIILEGTIAIGSEKKVPMPLRILCLIIEWAIFFGLGGLFVYMGYESVLQNDAVAAFLLLGVGLLMIIGGIFIAVKMFRKKKESQIEKENI